MQILIDCFSADQLSQMVYSKKAIQTIQKITEAGKGDELITLLEQVYVTQTPTLSDINRTLGENADLVLSQLGM